MLGHHVPLEQLQCALALILLEGWNPFSQKIFPHLAFWWWWWLICHPSVCGFWLTASAAVPCITDCFAKAATLFFPFNAPQAEAQIHLALMPYQIATVWIPLHFVNCKSDINLHTQHRNKKKMYLFWLLPPIVVYTTMFCVFWFVLYFLELLLKIM